MGKYRESRGIEASVVDFLEPKLETANWDNVKVVKSFLQSYKVYTIENPVICVNVSDISSVRKEIGTKLFNKTFTVTLRVFGTDDGNRLDLSDFLLDCLEDDIDYYEFTIEGGKFTQKELVGKISITRILRDEKELVNTENLAQQDKFRSIITFECHIVLS